MRGPPCRDEEVESFDGRIPSPLDKAVVIGLCDSWPRDRQTTHERNDDRIVSVRSL